MNLQQWLDEADPKLIKEFDDLEIMWIADSPKGPYQGKNGEFYMLSMKLDDGTVTNTWTDSTGTEKEGHGEFVSFSWKDWMSELQKGDHVACKLTYGTYNGKRSIKGSYLHRAETSPRAPATPAAPAPANNKVAEYETLISTVIDPLFNIIWAKVPVTDREQILTEHSDLITKINQYLSE